jgi:hypothetical protein
MNRIALFGAVVAAFVPGVVLADMNYTSLDINYLDLDGDGGVSGDGFEFGGSWELNDDFHLFGSWQTQSYDFGIDGDVIELGGGWNHGFSDTLDFVATLSWIDVDYDVASDDGLALGGGIRSRLGDSFEVEAGLKYVDMTESDTGLHLGARYYFNDSMALGASIDDNDNADTLRLGFRWEF